MSKHTEGPWVYSCGAVYARKDVDGYGVSCIALMDRENAETSPAERDANARLIAAAPALLEVVRRLVSWDDNTTHAVPGSLAEQARAALSSATLPESEVRDGV